jgi:hypothetical protein
MTPCQIRTLKQEDEAVTNRFGIWRWENGKRKPGTQTIS